MEERPLGVGITRMLAARGVAHVFGVPGVHNQELYRGLEGSGITHVLARHEAGAGFMADGYARATGGPGVAFVITGPGLTNILTPLGQAYSDSVPVLAISSCLAETGARMGQLHQMRDQRGAAGTVCAWSHEARSADEAYSLIDRALAEFRTMRPRPRHIQVPIPLLETAAPPPPPPVRTALAGLDCPAMHGPVARTLAAARRPIFVFGGGASRVDTGFIAALLERSGGAGFTTYAGRGLLPPGHPMSFGSYLGRPGSEAVIASADLIVVVGSELSECDLWRDNLGGTARMVRIDIDASMLTGMGAGDLPVLAEAGVFLQGVLDHLPEKAEPGWVPEEVAAARAHWQAEADGLRPGIVPVCAALAATMPRDLMVFSDMTQFAYVAKEVWDMAQPGSWHNPFGFGTLGYALPAAIGGALGRPERPVLAIAGDYGFQYTMQELGTAVELGLSLPILLWDNGALAEIAASMASAQIAPNAVIARNPDFLALARAYGAGAAAPESLEGLVDAINAAFTAGQPTLIRVTPDLSA